MFEYLKIILTTLAIGLVASIIATKVIDGLKVAFGTEDKHTFNRVLAVIMDLVFSAWCYFKIWQATDYFTFAIVCLLTMAGANAIYNILHDLEQAKKAIDETTEHLEGKGTEEIGEG